MQRPKQVGRTRRNNNQTQTKEDKDYSNTGENTAGQDWQRDTGDEIIAQRKGRETRNRK